MKRIIALILVFVMMGLVSCRAKIESGGKPIPDKVTSGAYEADPEEIIYYKIDEKGAQSLLGELNPIIKKMAVKTLKSDMVYLKKVVSYLVQFNDYEDDLGKYMHSVEKLCDTFYNFYVLNCTAKEVKEQIDEYYDTYYSLSDEFKNQYLAFDAADLYAISTRIGIMVEEILNPSEEPSSTEPAPSSTEPAPSSTEPEPSSTEPAPPTSSETASVVSPAN